MTSVFSPNPDVLSSEPCCVWRLPDLLLCLLTIFRQMGVGGRVKEPRDQVSTNKASQLPSREASFCLDKSSGQKRFIPTVDFFFFFKLGVRISLLRHHARNIQCPFSLPFKNNSNKFHGILPMSQRFFSFQQCISVFEGSESHFTCNVVFRAGCSVCVNAH